MPQFLMFGKEAGLMVNKAQALIISAVNSAIAGTLDKKANSQMRIQLKQLAKRPGG